MIQKSYEQSRKAGSSHKLAEMLALQQPPSLQGTDSIFMAGQVSGNQFEKSPWLGKAYKQISEKLAPGCTSGAVYKSQLARFAGDPLAWVRGTADVKKAAAIKGVDVDGVSVSHVSPVREKPPVPLADDILQARVKLEMLKNPKQRKEEAVEKVLYTHTPHWKRGLIKEHLKTRKSKDGKPKRING